MSKQNDDQSTVPVFVDGEKIGLPLGDTTARSVLVAAGLDPIRFDLGRKEGADSTRFGDDDIVTIKPGIRFFTVRESAPVA